MPHRPISRSCASPSPAAPPASASRWCAQLAARGARVAFVARTAADVERTAPRDRRATASSATSARKDDIHPIALQITGALGGLDVLVNNASSLGPVPLALLADTECEELEEALAANLVGAVPADQGAARRARRVGARGARRAGRQHLQRRGGQRLSRLGRLWREQGGAAPPDRDLGRGGARPTACASSRSIPATWTRRCTRSPCPTPIRSTLKRPRTPRPRDHRQRCWPRCRRPRAAPEPAHDRRRPSRPAARRSCSPSTPTAASGTAARARSAALFAPGDLVVANDAATLPASLPARMCRAASRSRSGLPAGSRSGDPHAASSRIAFGAGDHRTRTEDRPPPPLLAPGDRLALGPLARRGRAPRSAIRG